MLVGSIDLKGGGEQGYVREIGAMLWLSYYPQFVPSLGVDVGGKPIAVYVPKMMSPSHCSKPPPHAHCGKEDQPPTER